MTILNLRRNGCKGKSFFLLIEWECRSVNHFISFRMICWVYIHSPIIITIGATIHFSDLFHSMPSQSKYSFIGW